MAAATTTTTGGCVSEGPKPEENEALGHHGDGEGGGRWDAEQFGVESVTKGCCWQMASERGDTGRWLLLEVGLVFTSCL